MAAVVYCNSWPILVSLPLNIEVFSAHTCTYKYIHTDIHIHMCTHIPTHRHSDRHVHTHRHTHTYIYSENYFGCVAA